MQSHQDIDDLVAAYLEALDAGDHASMQQLRKANPALGSELDARLRTLKQAGFIEQGEASTDDFPQVLGEFRLLERLGEGGMGVVYLAEQTTLGRRVALKLVRPDQLYFQSARDRFKREVEVVARMAHPSIVPVYAVGEERGIPYFAMEHVPGVGLDTLVHELGTGDAPGPGALYALVARLAAERGWSAKGQPQSPPFDRDWQAACLWIVREMAQALEHAHQRGILHRDVKPSNAMLTPDGRVLLLDFGLASSANHERVTRSGSQPGSLAYMAPEQMSAAAGEPDVRTDVYALGVTLYELLALRLPFASKTGVELQVEISSGRGLPLRQVAPWVARDLETVVGVAMATRPEERYRSAADFARDLTNLLEHRPIEARPTGAWTQLVRWSQRNPAAAGLVAVLLVVVVGGPLLFGLQQRRANREQQRLTRREEAQRLRAEENVEQAFEAVRSMLVLVGDVRMENVPQTEELSLELLGSAVAFYDQLLERNPDVPRVLRLRAALGPAIAKILTRIGRRDEAEGALHRHLADLRRMRDLGLMPADVRRDLATALNGAGILQMADLRLDGAAESFAEAEALQREAMALEPEHLQAYGDLAVILGNQGLVLRSQGDLEGAAAAYEGALEPAREGLRRDPRDRDTLVAYTFTLSTLALICDELREYARAAELYDTAFELQLELAERLPDDADVLYSLTRTCVNQGALLRRLQLHERGFEVLERGCEQARALVRQYPAQLEFKSALGGALMTLGELQLDVEALDEAADTLAQACEVLDALAVHPGATAEQRMYAGQAHCALGRALMLAGRPDEAAEALFTAAERCEISWSANPTLPAAGLLLGHARMALAELDLRGGSTAGVAETLLEVRELVEYDPYALADLAGLWVDLSVGLGGQGAEAQAAQRQAVELLLAARRDGFLRTREVADSPRWASVRADPELTRALETEL